jgi:hypothetical protein
MPRYRIALVMLALLALGAVTPPAAAAQDATPDPSQQAAEAARLAAVTAARRLTFDPSLPGGGGCIGEVSDQEFVRPTMIVVDGSGRDASNVPRTAGSYGAWQTSGPHGSTTRPGEPVTIGLRDKFGTEDRFVYADVYRPDGSRDRAEAYMVCDHFADLKYPEGFLDGQPLIPGTYTVIWHDSKSDRLIACDGFVVTTV